MKEDLYDHLFHFNIYTELWNCFPKGSSVAYFNGDLEEDKILKAKDVNTIIKYLTNEKDKKKDLD